jgi:uncharacterized peroxidase-related enzyme
MPHIEVPPGVPGIVSLMAAYPETAGPLNALAQVLLRGPSPLTPGERELIAARVSAGNECVFCASSHSAAASELLQGNKDLVHRVTTDYTKAEISPKLKALLAIADKVRRDGRTVTESDVLRARQEGAVDSEIHHAVLIAAAFCMYNRYVDGLAAFTPTDPAVYGPLGKRLATNGYLNAVEGAMTAAPAAPGAAAPRNSSSKR